MAKDPAMLWYWSDWNSGTSLLSRFLKGCYIDILHAQFNNGHLSLEEIKICLGADFGSSWPTLQKKFKQDETGLFFNERLELEINKRKNFSESRRKNVSKRYKPTYVDTSVEHMNIHMENTNRNKDEIKNSLGKSENHLQTTPKIEEVERVFLQQGGTKEMALHFFNHHEAMGWKIRGTPIKNFSPLIGNFITNWKENQNGKSIAGTGNKSHPNNGSAAGAILLLNKVKQQFNT